MSRALQMIQALEQRSNIKFTLQSFPSKRSLHYANIGKVDGIFARLKTLKLDPRYSNLLLVDAPWMEDELVVISKKENSIEVSDWADLVGYDICYLRGTLVVERQLQSYPFTAYPLSKDIHAVKKVHASHCKFLVTWLAHLSPAALSFIQENSLQVGASLASFKGYMYIHRKHEHLLPLLQDALVNMEREGVRASIFLNPSKN
ncbi:substrate-binding periplasmic protein [Vibrio sp. HN007]|uniref:substrate-binding periplasmic protein n=1 Tax=Vibrio iocasae TaxID=3098914 RepID=UPI0035D4D39A